jgi:hypothetical protein
VPEGLSAADWSSIRAVYEANRHAAFPVEDGYVARNLDQQWRTRFDGRGFVTTPDGGGWSWGLELVRYGRAGEECTSAGPSRARQQAGSMGTPTNPSRDQEEPAPSRSRPGQTMLGLPTSVEAEGGRVSYRWDETLIEWYVNDPRGLEHGYTVHRRPAARRSRAGMHPTPIGCGNPRIAGTGPPPSRG